jgi:pyrimidine operon attenuation protein/uracil phosphoribosyltransferase
MHLPGKTDITFSVEGREVVLIDDVLHTGRTIRAAMDALLDFGRPSNVKLMVLIDRRYSREVPVQPDFTGRVVDTVSSQKVKVQWKDAEVEDSVILID